MTQEQAEPAWKLGATDREILGTILISSLFCMFDHYVDGLGTFAPTDRKFYINRGNHRTEEGNARYDAKN